MGGGAVQRPRSSDLPSSELLNPNSTQGNNNFITFEAVLTKQPGMVLGMELLPVKAVLFSGLWVEVVCKGGMVDAWNQANPAPYNIRPGDCIVHVNGVSSDSPAMMMMEELCTRQEIRLTVRRSADGMRPLVAPSDTVSYGAASDAAAMNMAAAGGIPSQNPGGIPPAPCGLPPPSGLAGGMGNGPPMGNGGPPMGTGGAPPSSNGGPPMGGGGPPMGNGPMGLRSRFQPPPGISAPPPGISAPQFVNPAGGQGNYSVPPAAPPAGLDAGDLCDVPEEDYSNQSLALALPSRNPVAPPAPAPQEPVFSFDVDIKSRPGMRLGIEVMLVSSSTCGLVIKRVVDGGLVSEWNERQNPPFRVQPGDYILQVNGIGCWDSARMAEEFSKKYQTLEFTIQRGGHGGSMGGVPGPCRAKAVQPCPGQMPHQQHPQIMRPMDAPQVQPFFGNSGFQGAPAAPPPPTGFLGSGGADEGMPDAPPGLPIRRMPQPDDMPKAPPPPPPALGRQANPERGWHNMPGLPPPGQTPSTPIVPQRSQEGNAHHAQMMPQRAQQDANMTVPPVRPTSGPTSDAIPRSRLLGNMVAPPGAPGTGPAVGPAATLHGAMSRVGDIAAVGGDDFDASSTRQLTQLFQSTLQLNDDEMSQLFREALQRRPWLRALVAQALGVL